MGKYDFDLNLEEGMIPRLIMDQILPGKEVLEFGCANGRMTRYMQEAKSCKVSIVELDESSFRDAIAYAADGVCADIDAGLWQEHYAGKQFDYVIFADVLEHLRAPEKTLAQVKRFLKPEGKVLVSIPNIGHNDVVAMLFENSFAYKELGLLDNTHIHFWGYRELQALAENAGYVLEILDGVCLPPFVTELGEAGKDAPPALKQLLGNRDYNEVYQFFFVLRTKEWAEENNIVTDVRLKKSNTSITTTFYWDLGEGYQAEQYALISGKRDRSLLTFCVEDIPEGCVKVRFDPPGESPFMISGCVAVVDDKDTYSLTALNGTMIDNNTFLFRDVLAQMELALPEGAKKFVVKAEIQPCLENDAQHLIAVRQAHQEDREHYDAQLQSQREEINRNYELLVHIDAQMQSRQEEINRNHELLAHIARELQEHREAVAYSNELLLSKAVEVERYKEKLEENQAEKEKLSAEIDRLTQELKELEQKNTVLLEMEQTYMEVQHNTNLLQAEYESVRDQFLATLPYKQAYEELAPAYRQLASQYETTLIQYQYMSNSRAWRLTAPARKVWGKFRASRVGSLFCKTVRHLRMFGIRATMKKVLQYLKQRRTAAQPALPPSDEAILDMNDLVRVWEAAGADIALKESVLGMKSGNRVLIVSHEFNLTGAPVAIEYMANCMRQLGKEVLIVSPHDGRLRPRITEAGIANMVFDRVYQCDLVKRSAPLFDLVVVSTNVGAPLIDQLGGLPVPVIWWIHEARASYFEAALNAMPQRIGNNIHVYCGGEYAQRLLKEYRPEYPTDLFLYCTSDFANSDVPRGQLDLTAAEGKKVFALVGMLEERKGQDILAEAIRRLPPEKLQQCYFVLVGTQCYPPQYVTVTKLCQEFPDNVRYIEELKREDLACLYDRMDCLICASRDDPMPIVVADAMSMSKCVICSENTGSAALFRAMNSGLIYRNNSPDELAACIAAALDGVEDMSAMCHRARQTYEQYFTQKVFKANLVRIVNKIAPNLDMALSIADMYLPGPGNHPREIYGQEILVDYRNNGSKNILLISHELSLSGAPVVLHKMAKELRSQGHNITVVSPYDGPLREKFVDDNFPVIVFGDLYDKGANDFLTVFGNSYDLIVMNTLVNYWSLHQLSGLLTPVIWWIHDSRASYTYGGYGDILPEKVAPNVKILCGGSYAKDQLLHYYPHYQAEELLYAIDDCVENKGGKAPKVNSKGKKLFLIAGTVERRKGQDIAAEAIRKLPADVLEKCYFVFMGKVIEQPVMDAVENLCREMPENVCYMEPISRDDLIALYREATCLICSSRDDPMPVVVTEMQALSKPVICSENTGSAALIHNYGGGYTYSDDDPAKLAEQICRMAKASRRELAAMGKEGRGLYESCFSEKVFAQELRTLVEQECTIDRKCEMATVSVVIPSYNAGEAFREMLTRLNSQKGVANVEVVVVDSGSSDGTPQMAAEYGAKLIQISQAEFSHSHARNLGAENASGQVLLFMTQDALPADENWVKEMVKPILAGECCAVSCAEQCPEGTDLYYRVASWGHALYLGIQHESKIGKYVPGMAAEELRKNASLNDVSTAIDRTLFRQMGYRHSFAEDLDMGIRILKAGKRIKLLHDPAVVHGHTRPASYYLRRGLAEGRALERIMEAPEADISAKTLAEMIITGYGVLQNAMVQIQTEAGIDTLSAFDKRFTQLIQTEMASPRKAVYGQTGSDAYVEGCVQKLEDLNLAVGNTNFDLVHMIMPYWSCVLSVCLKEISWDRENLAEQVCGCIYKQMCLIMGSSLAHMDPAEPCFQEFQKLANGV